MICSCAAGGLIVAPALLVASAAHAQIAVSANDAKPLLVDGKTTFPKDPPPDSATIVDLKTFPPKVIGEVADVPTSVVGPPSGVALTPDEGLALISSGVKMDPADPTKTVPDNRLTVIDLKASPPKVIARLEAGRGAAGLSINRKGDLALVANRAEGTVSVFSIQGKTVAKVGDVAIGDKTGPSHAVFTPDGKTALVTLDADHAIVALSIDGQKVEVGKRKLTTGVRPYDMDINAAGTLAVAGNMGRSDGDIDSISVVDLTANPYRVVDTIGLGGQSPEGVRFSPDGKHLAIALQDGSNKAKNSPHFNPGGKLILFRIEGTKLTRVAEATLGHWTQGIAFSADGQTILTQNMVEKNLMVFRFEGGKLTDTGQRVALKGGPAGIRTAK
jgi:DNA-binding beta-propeller fold protein YncE